MSFKTNDVYSVAGATSAAAKANGCYLVHVNFSGGAAGDDITIYDNDDDASGTILYYAKSAANGETVYAHDINVEAKVGLFVVTTGASSKAQVYY